MKAVFMLSSAFSVVALLTIVVFLLARGVPAIADIGLCSFIFGKSWAPTAAEPSFGILPMIAGSVYVTALATLFGVTIGLFMSIFLYKFCPKRLSFVVRQFVNLLAGVPSVIFGLAGLIVVVPLLRAVSTTGVGHGILAASLILGVMVLPTVVSISLDALHAVPETNYEAALALGATKERAVFGVMVPGAKSGIYASVVLSVGRAIGETMAVIMVIGGSPDMPASLFQSVRTLTANIALGAMDMSGRMLDALIATGVVLLVFTLIINISFAAFKHQSGKNKKKRPASWGGSEAES